jgi:hypothetical protein
VGIAGVAPVSLAELFNRDPCPHLGPVPACHIVLLGYGTVILTALHRRLWNPWVFAAGLAPVLVLAAAGSGLELFGIETCPRTAGGTPKCFFSLALAAAVAAPFVIHVVSARRRPA